MYAFRFNFTKLLLQEGWTPLHIAMQTRNRDIGKVLLVNGADKTRRTKVFMIFCFSKLAQYSQYTTKEKEEKEDLNY